MDGRQGVFQSCDSNASKSASLQSLPAAMARLKCQSKWAGQTALAYSSGHFLLPVCWYVVNTHARTHTCKHTPFHWNRLKPSPTTPLGLPRDLGVICLLLSVIKGLLIIYFAPGDVPIFGHQSDRSESMRGRRGKKAHSHGFITEFIVFRASAHNQSSAIYSDFHCLLLPPVVTS